VLLVIAALLTLLADGLAASRPSRTLDDAIAQGQRAQAPSLRLPSLGTRATYTLRMLRGRVVILNVWASWCPPCAAEAPLLERWYRRIAPLGGTVVGVDTFDTTSDARSFIRRLHLTYPMLRDAGGQVKNAFGVIGFPESFVIDRRGRVAALQRGPVDDAFMLGTVVPLLAGRS
jgi:cytochrome c biogenesis protein CcmG/thiol:disulfide interchange protein DsbE